MQSHSFLVRPVARVLHVHRSIPLCVETGLDLAGQFVSRTAIPLRDLASPHPTRRLLSAAVSSAASARLECRGGREPLRHGPSLATRPLASARSSKDAQPVGHHAAQHVGGSLGAATCGAAPSKALLSDGSNLSSACALSRRRPCGEPPLSVWSGILSRLAVRPLYSLGLTRFSIPHTGGCSVVSPSLAPGLVENRARSADPFALLPPKTHTRGGGCHPLVGKSARSDVPI